MNVLFVYTIVAEHHHHHQIQQMQHGSYQAKPDANISFHAHVTGHSHVRVGVGGCDPRASCIDRAMRLTYAGASCTSGWNVHCDICSFSRCCSTICALSCVRSRSSRTRSRNEAASSFRRNLPAIHQHQQQQQQTTTNNENATTPRTKEASHTLCGRGRLDSGSEGNTLQFLLARFHFVRLDDRLSSLQIAQTQLFKGASAPLLRCRQNLRLE